MRRSRCSTLISLALIATVALPYYAPLTCALLDRMEMGCGAHDTGASDTIAMIGSTSDGMEGCQIPACGLAHVAPIARATTASAVPEPAIAPLPAPPPLFQSVDLVPPAPPPQA